MSRKVLIIEDEKVHVDALCKILEDLQRDIVVYCANNIEQALKISFEQHIHLFLVDIVLNTQKPGDVSGLNFVRELRGMSKYKFTPVIFITSLEDPKLHSYSHLHCFGYIEKPFSVNQIKNVVLEALEFPMKENDDKYVYFQKNGITYPIHLKDIIYIQNSKRKIKIVCVKDELEVPYKTCEEILKDLDSESFIQCSRYCIINRKYVEYTDYSNRFVKLKNVKEPIGIGVMTKKAFKQRMENE